MQSSFDKNAATSRYSLQHQLLFKTWSSVVFQSILDSHFFLLSQLNLSTVSIQEAN